MRQRLFARRWRRILAILGVAVLAVGALHRRRGLALPGAKQPNVGELAFANRLALPELAEPTIDEDGARCSTCGSWRARPSSSTRGRPVGTQRHLPGAHAPGRARRSRESGRHQRRRRGDHAALARDTPARTHGRRAPSYDRPGRDLVIRVDDRPAGCVALVPPPRPRCDRGSRLPPPACSSSTIRPPTSSCRTPTAATTSR
jgi:hypothetical protein